jgi:hypothetical protein
VAALLNESHLIDFAHGGQAGADFGQAAFAESDHALFDGAAFDFGSGAAIDDHFANAVGQVEKFADGGAAMITRTGAFETASTFGEDDVGPSGGIETSFLKLDRRKFPGTFAVFADYANEALGHDAVQSGDEVVRLDAHVDEAANDIGNVVGVNGGENQMSGKGGLNGDLRGFLVADFADHDFVGVVAKDGTQAASKGEALFLVDRNLGDALELVFDGIFDGDDFVFVAFDFVDGGVESGGFAGAGGAGDEDHAVRLLNVLAEAFDFEFGEADDVEAKALEFFGKRFLIENTENSVFAVAGGHDGDAEVDETAFVFDAEAAVLWDAAFGDVQIAENFDARKNGGVPLFGDGLHGVLEDAVDAVLDGDFGVASFDVDVTGAAFERREDDGFDEADDGADGGVAAREAVAGDGLFALFLFLGNLQSEGFGGLLENALGLLSAFEDVADLAGGGDLDGELFAEEERKLVAQQNEAGIGNGDAERVVLYFEGDEVVAEHQVRGDSAEKFRVDVLFAEIDEGAAVAAGEFACEFALVCGVGSVAWCPILFLCSHSLLTLAYFSLLCRCAREGERKNRQIKRNQNKGYQQAHEYENNGLDDSNESAQPDAHFFFVEFGDAGEHGSESAGRFADFDHVEGEFGHGAFGGEGAVKRFAFTDHLSGLGDGGANELAADGVGGGLQASNERRAASEECGERTGKLRDLKFQEGVAEDGYTEFEAIEGFAAFFGSGPHDDAEHGKKNERDDAEDDVPVVHGESDEELGGTGEFDVEVAIENGELGDYETDEIGDDDGGDGDQENGIDERGENFFLNAGAHFLVGDVVLENAGEVAAFFTGENGGGVDLGKNASFGDGFGKGFAFADAVADFGEDGAKFGRGGAVGEKIESAEDRKTGFDERVELLIEDEEIGAADLAFAAAFGECAEEGAARVNGIDE